MAEVVVPRQMSELYYQTKDEPVTWYRTEVPCETAVSNQESASHRTVRVVARDCRCCYDEPQLPRLRTSLTNGVGFTVLPPESNQKVVAAQLLE